MSRGRKKTMYRLHEVEPQLLDIIAFAKKIDAGVTDAVAAALPILIRTRTDDRLKALRVITRAFESPRDIARRIAEVVDPMRAYPARPRRKKKRMVVRPKKKPRVLTGRRACRYGAGAYGPSSMVLQNESE